MGRGRILLTGGTGMIGSALAKQLITNNYEVIVLTRDPKSAAKKDKESDIVSYAHWDVKKQTIDNAAIAAADAIVHLAGAGVVAKPWTDAYKKEILESRVQSSALIIKALQEVPNKVETIVSASAIGWYGNDKEPTEPFVETDPVAPGFLGDTCYHWEQSIRPVTALGKRLVICRFGIVLSNAGGAFVEFKKPLKTRVAAVLGDGTQIVSWIHIHDLCRLIQFTIEQKLLHGVYNAVSPQPVSNTRLTVALAKAMYGNAYIKMHVPSFVLKVMMGDRSIEVLKSATVSSAKIQQANFQFEFPDISQAVENLVYSS